MHADFQRTRHDADQFAAEHFRPQSPSFLGHVVGYKLSRVALGTRMAAEREGQLTTGKRAERTKRDIQCQQFVVLHW